MTTHADGTRRPREPPDADTKPLEISRWSWAGLKRDIAKDHTDIPIIACCFTSGLCDSSALNAWNTFVSMQTGNTIILALGASNQPRSEPYSWLKSLTAILLFLLGCFFFSSTRHLGRVRTTSPTLPTSRLSPISHATLFLSFLLQALLIFIAAALVQTAVVPSPRGYEELDPSNVQFIELVPIALLAFQSGGQIVTSRQLGLNEVPTTVLTSLYCDLVSDPHLLAKENVKRNRRIASVVTLLLGGIIGGWCSRKEVGMSAALWLAGSVKVAIAVGFACWKERVDVPL